MSADSKPASLSTRSKSQHHHCPKSHGKRTVYRKGAVAQMKVNRGLCSAQKGAPGLSAFFQQQKSHSLTQRFVPHLNGKKYMVSGSRSTTGYEILMQPKHLLANPFFLQILCFVRRFVAPSTSLCCSILILNVTLEINVYKSAHCVFVLKLKASL